MPSNDDHDKSASDTSPSKSENPFIKFRQFADSQISSLLHNILGVPSAFSKPKTPRSDAFDEDLRRRDELMARQQALKDFEASRQQSDSEEQSFSIPVKTSPDWKHGPYHRLAQNAMDLPLYSSMDSVRHLLASPDSGEEGWHDLPSASANYSAASNPTIQNIIAVLRNGAYMKLSSAESSSQKSLLPYLLFSPYSPFKLELEDANRAEHGSAINYNLAFADLLTTAYGKPQRLDVRSKALPRLERHPTQSISRHMQQIDWLKSKGLLEEPKSTNASSSIMSQDASTEQEMYEAFLRLASIPMVAASAFESLFKEVETSVEKALDPKEEDRKSVRIQKSVEREHAEGLRELDSLIKGLGNAFKEEKARVKSSESNPESDRVVSTRTVTEHSTDEYGVVETSVTVEKVFADGRITTTHTSHTEESLYDWEEKISKEKEPETKNTEEQKSKEQKGWFWN